MNGKVGPSNSFRMTVPSYILFSINMNEIDNEMLKALFEFIILWGWVLLMCWKAGTGRVKELKGDRTVIYIVQYQYQ